MPDMTPVIEAKRAARKLFGGEHAKAVPIFEHCVNYDLQELARLVNMTKEIEGNIFAEDIQEKIQTFCRLRDELKPVRDQRPVYLWPEGKIPCLSDYTDNADHLYNHEPDYVPFMYEVLLAEDVTPKGAVILCPGGDHGRSTVNTYQVALDLNALGVSVLPASEQDQPSALAQ